MSGCDGFPPGGRAECGWMMIHRRRKAFGWVPCLHSPFPVVGLGLICLGGVPRLHSPFPVVGLGLICLGGVPRLHSPFPVCGDWLVSLGSTLCCLVGRCPTPCRWRCPRTPARELTPWTPRRCAANWRFALFHYSLFTISLPPTVSVPASGSSRRAASRRVPSAPRPPDGYIPPPEIRPHRGGWFLPSQYRRRKDE